MPAYQQMGHHSENLLFEPKLSAFQGAVLSPVNYDIEATREQVQKCASTFQDFDLIFDPQLYYPNTERGCLDRWSYFPADVDTADLSSATWWQSLVARLATVVTDLNVSAVCSPSVVPRTFSDSYYSQATAVTSSLIESLGPDVRVLQTALVDFASIAEPGRAKTVASILSGGDADEVFLVVTGGPDPRRELADADSLAAVMRLVAALETAEIKVLVGFSSSDMLLWKAAGATSCATGKFFNLRRFTASRFDEPSGGGGQLPYWLEESLLAFLRESDVVRVEREGLLSDASRANPFAAEILDRLRTHPGTAWLALAWRQFLYWFADAEARLTADRAVAGALAKTAEGNWLHLDDRDVLMEEPRNDGSWVRPWRRALSEFAR